jgi:hypothetical protein
VQVETVNAIVVRCYAISRELESFTIVAAPKAVHFYPMDEVHRRLAKTLFYFSISLGLILGLLSTFLPAPWEWFVRGIILGMVLLTTVVWARSR